MSLKPRIVSDHVLQIDVMYFEKAGRHKWRATCTCGFQTPWTISPKTADRELRIHERLHEHDQPKTRPPARQ